MSPRGGRNTDGMSPYVILGIILIFCLFFALLLIWVPAHAQPLHSQIVEFTSAGDLGKQVTAFEGCDTTIEEYIAYWESPNWEDSLIYDHQKYPELKPRYRERTKITCREVVDVAVTMQEEIISNPEYAIVYVWDAPIEKLCTPAEYDSLFVEWEEKLDQIEKTITIPGEAIIWTREVRE